MTVNYAEFCDHLNLKHEETSLFEAADVKLNIEPIELDALSQLGYNLYKAIAEGPKANLQSVVLCAGTLSKTKYLFKNFVSLLHISPWFNALHRDLEDCEQKDGVIRLKFNDKYIHYVSLNLFAYPYNDSTPTKLRGHTYAAALLDTREFLNASEYERTLILGLRSTQGILTVI